MEKTVSNQPKQPCEVCGAVGTRRRLWRRENLPDLWACVDITYCNARKRKAERAAAQV